MVSFLLNASFINPSSAISISSTKCKNSSRSCQQEFSRRVSCSTKSEQPYSIKHGQTYSPLLRVTFAKSVIPVAACLAVVFCSNPAYAGFLSGSTGIESVPGPELPQLDFLSRFNEENQKKYAENDARFKESPILKKLLEQSKVNKEKNRQAVLDKYCLRGAEWGVGDCSAEGMSPEEREKFIAMLKQKAGVE